MWLRKEWKGRLEREDNKLRKLFRKISDKRVLVEAIKRKKAN